MMNLKYRPPGYSSPGLEARAENLCADILYELAKANMPAVAELDDEGHYQIVFTVGDNPYNVMVVHEVFERRQPTGKFKFDYHRVYMIGVYGTTCRKYEQTELAKQHSLTKVVSVLKDRYLAIQSAQTAAKNQEDTEKARKAIVARLRRDFRGYRSYIHEGDTTDVELRFQVDDSTARAILGLLNSSGVSR